MQNSSSSNKSIKVREEQLAEAHVHETLEALLREDSTSVSHENGDEEEHQAT